MQNDTKIVIFMYKSVYFEQKTKWKMPYLMGILM